MADGFDDARAFWDARYATDEYVFGREPNRFLVSQRAMFTPGAAVLDVATGEGRNALWLAQLGCRVTGIDVSPLGLAKARRMAAEAGVNVEFEQVDVRNWHWPEERFDAIVTIFIQFAAPDDRSRVFDGMKRALRPGGVIVMQGYTPRQLEYRTGGPPQAEHMYTEALLREAFSDMEILHLREYEDVLAEGSKHVGRSALIDMVARKRG
ncbi:MAG: class I SAM-dependent methyltransferase [Burkholderiales bacterium]|nr:class I SAM-dependent methyltransferase [Burkholderiales bacterium]